MNNNQLLLIKLGGSVITNKNKPYALRTTILRRLAKELKEIHQPLLISHGGGSYAHTSAKKYGGMKGYSSKEGLAEVAFDVQQMNFLVVKELLSAKIPAILFRPMSMILTTKGKVTSSLFTGIRNALQQGLVPVVHGDVIIDTAWKTTIYSGETTLGILTEYLLQSDFSISKVIEIGTTDGVYDFHKKPIPSISSHNIATVKSYLHKTPDDVTGGMLHKIEEALLLAQKGIRTILINGNRPNELLQAALDEKIHGTIVT